MESVTTDKIIAWLTSQIEQKQPIDGNTYMDAATKLNVLLQGEQELLFDMEQNVAQKRQILLEDGKPVSFAKMMLEATDEYKVARKQKAKIDRIIEFIRLSKLNSRMASDLMRNQL